MTEDKGLSLRRAYSDAMEAMVDAACEYRAAADANKFSALKSLAAALNALDQCKKNWASYQIDQVMAFNPHLMREPSLVFGDTGLSGIEFGDQGHVRAQPKRNAS